ncbi:MAG TPA: hypothetical protein VGM18_05905 [Candidatus Sulfotelmatobacter sp.]
MSVAGISSSSTFNNASNPAIHNNLQKFQQEFQQLGTDLQSGNISAAQQEFAQLGVTPQSNPAASPLQSTDPILQTLQQLGQDLQSGNLAGAQQEYGAAKQDFQKIEQTHLHHRHLHVQTDPPGSQPGQNLQTGDVSAAQSAYSSLLGDLQQVGLSFDPAAALTPAGSAGVSVSA